MINRHARTFKAALTLGLLASAVWLGCAPTRAHADFTVGADLEAVVPIDSEGIKTGPGFGVRIGTQLHLPLVVVTPEIGFHYSAFDNVLTVKDYRGIIGARVGIGEAFRIGAYGHVGFGHITYSLSRTSDALDSNTGFTFDLGAFLDLTLIPLLDIGVHLGYGNTTTRDRYNALQWLNAGIHAALVF
ncbi:MAG: hypothetical protein RL701_2789 [Pseudomonadota bacterium]|jgi:hypothetical protein